MSHIRDIARTARQERLKHNLGIVARTVWIIAGVAAIGQIAYRVYEVRLQRVATQAFMARAEERDKDMTRRLSREIERFKHMNDVRERDLLVAATGT